MNIIDIDRLTLPFKEEFVTVDALTAFERTHPKCIYIVKGWKIISKVVNLITSNSGDMPPLNLNGRNCLFCHGHFVHLEVRNVWRRFQWTAEGSVEQNVSPPPPENKWKHADSSASFLFHRPIQYSSEYCVLVQMLHPNVSVFRYFHNQHLFMFTAYMLQLFLSLQTYFQDRSYPFIFFLPLGPSVVISLRPAIKSGTKVVTGGLWSQKS